MNKLRLLAAASLSLSSCGIYTKYHPETEVPDKLHGEEYLPQQQETVSLGCMDWHELFTDPCLQRLIEQGLRNNTDYLSAQLRVKEADKRTPCGDKSTNKP